MEELNLLQRIANRDMKTITGDDGKPVKLPSIGQFVGRFRIDSVLGNGGVGAVFKVVDPEAEMIRAVKIPFPDTSRRDLDRFRLEAKICANLDHQNIVRVYNIGLHKGILPYAVMDYIPGKNLREWLKKEPVPIPVGLGIVALLCQVLEYIHAQTFTIDGKTHDKLIHRDIKPSNIIVSDKGVIKILDFGLAKFEGVEFNNTITGALPGTPAYMAPEQHQKPVGNVKTDIFSIGVTFYEAITGVRPFPEEGEDSFARMIVAKTTGQFKLPSSILKNVPPKVDEIVTRCLNPEPSKRYPTYAPLRMAVITMLDEYAQIEPESIVKMYFTNRKSYSLAIPDKVEKRKLRIPVLPVVGIFAVVAIVTATVFIIGHFRNKSDNKKLLNPSSVLVVNEKTAVETHPANIEKTPHYGSTTGDANSENVVTTQKNTQPPTRGKDIPQATTQIGKVSDNSPIRDAVLRFKQADFKGVLEKLTYIDLDNLRAIQRDSVVLMIMESYYRTDEYNLGLVYGLEHATSDAKYHLLLALFYQSASMKEQAESSFSKAITAPAKFDATVRLKTYLYRARFYQQLFESGRDEHIREKMINAWKDFLSNGCARQSPECDEARRIVGEN